MLNNYKNKIISFYNKHKRMPSYSEIMKITNLKSKSSIHKIVKKLEELGEISKDKQGKIIPNKILNHLKVLGVVEAGFPSAAEEELSDTMSLDEYLISNKEATYLLKVKGDSMIDAGIHEGDMLIVERCNTAKDGQIVIAEVDRKWSVKYYRKEKGQVFLEPANKKYKAIYPKEELKIAAVVKAVVRKY